MWQKTPDLNRTVFAEVVSKKPLRGIMEVTGLSAAAVYDKLDFLYRQCRGFAGDARAVSIASKESTCGSASTGRTSRAKK